MTDAEDGYGVRAIPGTEKAPMDADKAPIGADKAPTGAAPAPVPRRQASVYNIANALTVLRLLLVPVFGVLLLHERGQAPAHGPEFVRYRVLAAAVFALAIVTDGIDGDIARRRSLVTDFGTVSDPIADKALMGMALVGLSLLHELSWWVTVVILAREIGITVLRFFVIRHGVIPASRGGKAKTAAQAVALGLYVLPFSGWWHAAAMVVMAIAVVLTVVTGADYVMRAVRLRRTSPRAQAKRTRQAAMDLQRRRQGRPDLSRTPHPVRPAEPRPGSAPTPGPRPMSGPAPGPASGPAPGPDAGSRPGSRPGSSSGSRTGLTTGSAEAGEPQ